MKTVPGFSGIIDGQMTVSKPEVFWEKTQLFSATLKLCEVGGNTTRAHHSLSSTSLYGSSSGVKVADTASGEQEPSDNACKNCGCSREF